MCTSSIGLGTQLLDHHCRNAKKTKTKNYFQQISVGEGFVKTFPTLFLTDTFKIIDVDSITKHGSTICKHCSVSCSVTMNPPTFPL